jgi:polysaccharide chain length determinant protein (PEP-CTERM system associated)
MTPEYVFAALRRRFWYVVFPFFAIALMTVLYCIKAPRVYKSSSLILIQPQEVPTEYVQPTITTNIHARLSVITEQVMSRSRLEEIIKKHNLYPKIRSKSTLYDATERIRKDITLDIKDGGKRGRRLGSPAAFQVTFEGRQPTVVRDVTAAIANLFVDYNFRIRAEQAAGTTKFLDRELTRTKDELRQKEEAVRQFKEENMGLLPEQMENNYRILAQQQQHLDSVNNALQQTEDRKILLQTQLSGLETMSSAAPAGEEGTDLQPVTIEEAQEQLKFLRTRYSERHPDVIKLKAMIENMEKEDQIDTSATEGDSDGSSPSSRTRSLMEIQKQNLLVQLKMVGKEIDSLRQVREKTRNQILIYQRRIEGGPRTEQMFVDVRRDYERASENYQSLLKKKLQAELAENLERTQKGEQFTILDPANLPQKPFKPNVPKILTAGLFLALAAGLGLGGLREYVDPAFWNSKELESFLELPLLVSIPLIPSERERRRKVLKMAAAACVLLVMSTTLLYALFILWKRNPGLLPL